MTETLAFIPCSAKHKGCTPAHAALVWGYREERARQVALLEEITKGYEGDEKLYFARGGAKLITFKDWLKAHKGSAAKQAAQVVEIAEAIVASAWDNSVPAWAC